MTDKGVIFTDVDGTLVFHKKYHAIRELEHHPDGTFLVEDPITMQTLRALDVSVPPLTVYLAESTRRLAHCLREKYHIIITTGATENTMRIRKPLDFADAYILEHGGSILNADFKEDPQWAEILHPYRETLMQIKRDLKDAGWRIIMDEDRTTSLQVRAFENSQRTPEEFQDMCRSLKLPEGFEKTTNLGDLTVVPAVAWNGRAVAFYLRQHPELARRSIGIGDDFNDLDFLRLCQKVFVLGSALPDVIRHARERGWYVSSWPHFQGIDEILTTILNSSPD